MNVRDREDALVARLHALAPSPDSEPDPAFRTATRTRLVAMAAVRTPEPAPVSTLQRLLSARAADAAPVRWRSRVTAGLVGAALAVTAVASLVAVADDARPGDVLYDLKRGTEQTQLALAGDSRGQTLLDFASTRLDELEALVGDGGTALPATPAGPGDATVSAAGVDPALVLETLRTMDEQTREGTVWLTGRAVDARDEGPLRRLSDWAGGQAGDLAALRPLVPEAATEAVGQSLGLLTEIGTRSDGLTVALDCAGGPAVAGTDDLGPVPAVCPVPEAPPSAGGGTPEPETGTAPQSTVPEGSTPGQPTTPSVPQSGTGGGTTTGSGSESGSGSSTPSAPSPAVPTPTTPRLPVPTPTTPRLPGPTVPLPTLPVPTLPLPTQPPVSSSTVIQLPPVGPITVCLPPLATIGC